MTNPKFYIKTLDNVPRLGCAPLNGGGSIKFNATGSGGPSTLTLYFTGTNPLSTSTVTLGQSYTVTSTPGTYYFRVQSEISAPRFQIAVVSSGGISAAEFNYYHNESPPSLRVKLGGQTGSNGKITIDLQLEDNPGSLRLWKYGPSESNGVSKDLGSGDGPTSWELDGPTSSSEAWRFELENTSYVAAEGINAEELGGLEGDLDVEPPPP